MDLCLKNAHNKPDHTTILPFTRLLSAPMDYTPGIFNLKDYRYNGPDDRRKQYQPPHTQYHRKKARSLLVIYAPVQMAPDLPENFEGHPAFQFILDVPTDLGKKHNIEW
ncbi:MAG: hypothetical protein Ct9H300mP9_2990 [Candidatus Neomarinimicrobiota bacterium]|nr:MAG: hypothetical protein Ct9H300mP9_2990 [Candidatus Neomarinimicrobiota bacterium]